MSMRQNSGRLLALDGLRGFAALMVFFHHTLHVPAGGYLGVDLFFVLSGFLISSILVRENKIGLTLGFIQFYWRRAQRMMPAFLIMIIFYICIRFCFSLDQPSVGLVEAFKVLMFSDFEHVIPYLSHCWSLSVEWQFYFVWPFLLKLMLKSGIRNLQISILAVGLVLVIWVLRPFSHVDIRLDGLLLGSALALSLAGRRLTLGRIANLFSQSVLIVALISVITLMFESDYAGTFIPTWISYASMPILGTIIIFIVGQTSSLTSQILLENKILVYFGRISYGLYLYHFPVAALMYSHGYSPVSSMIVGLFVCVPLSDFSWRYIEYPFLKMHIPTNFASLFATMRL